MSVSTAVESTSPQRSDRPQQEAIALHGRPPQDYVRARYTLGHQHQCLLSDPLFPFSLPFLRCLPNCEIV